MTSILDALESSKSNLNVAVLDCCRDNPFTRAWRLTRSTGNTGLAALAESDIPEGTLVAFATPKGDVASDGRGNNSPFTAELAAVLNQRPRNGLLLFDVFREASRAVKEKTGQTPWANLDMTIPKFYLYPPQETVAKVGTTPVIELPRIDEAKPTPNDGPLFEQASVYLRKGDYANAITAFSAIIDDSSLPNETRQKARKSRGAAYLGRGDEADLDKAIIDHMAAGLTGIPLSVRVDSAELKTGKTAQGTVTKGQVVVVVDRVDGKWLWVKSVNGDETLRGWVGKSALWKTKSPEPARSSSGGQTRSQAATSIPGGADQFTREFMRRHGRPPTIWETPRWESPAEIKRLRAQGLLR